MKESFWFGAGSPAFFSLAFFESIYIFVKLMFSAKYSSKAAWQFAWFLFSFLKISATLYQWLFSLSMITTTSILEYSQLFVIIIDAIGATYNELVFS